MAYSDLQRLEEEADMLAFQARQISRFWGKDRNPGNRTSRRRCQMGISIRVLLTSIGTRQDDHNWPLCSTMCVVDGSPTMHPVTTNAASLELVTEQASRSPQNSKT